MPETAQKISAQSFVERHAAWERANQEQREMERQHLFANYLEHKAFVQTSAVDLKESSSHFTVSLLEESGNIMVGSPQRTNRPAEEDKAESRPPIDSGAKKQTKRFVLSYASKGKEKIKVQET